MVDPKTAQEELVQWGELTIQANRFADCLKRKVGQFNGRSSTHDAAEQIMDARDEVREILIHLEERCAKTPPPQGAKRALHGLQQAIREANGQLAKAEMEKTPSGFASGLI